jgi:hypothetical protein
VHSGKRAACNFDALDFCRAQRREIVTAAARIRWIVHANTINEHDGEIRFGAA